MLTEEFCMKIFQFELEYTVAFLGRCRRLRPIRAVINSLIVVCFIPDIILMYTLLPVSIYGLMTFMLVLSSWNSLLALVATEFTRKQNAKSMYKTILETDDQLNKALAKEKDWTLILLAGIYPWVVVSNILFIGVGTQHQKVLMSILRSSIVYEIVCLTIMKYLLTKRLRYFRSAEEFMERIEDTISVTRQLLELNSQLNESFGYIATSFTLYAFQSSIQFGYTSWAINTAYSGTLEVEKRLYTSSLVNVSGICLTAFLLAVLSSSVAAEVNEIKMELDISRTGRPCTDKQMSLISLFLMELHYSPVQLTALDLFDVDRITFATACGSFVSFLLVIIQFT